jgi:hypothetical protein
MHREEPIASSHAGGSTSENSRVDALSLRRGTSKDLSLSFYTTLPSRCLMCFRNWHGIVVQRFWRNVDFTWPNNRAVLDSNVFEQNWRGNSIPWLHFKQRLHVEAAALTVLEFKVEMVIRLRFD